MRAIKWLLLFLLSFIVLLLISGIFLKKEIHVYKEINIQKNKDTVFNFLKYLQNQKFYSVWDKMDTSMKKHNRGTDGEVGFEICWESKNEELGKGCQKIIKIIPGRRAEVLLTFNEPFESEYLAYYEVNELEPNVAHVRWGLKSQVPYPYNILTLFYNLEDALGKDLNKGLENLKAYLESR